MRAGGQARFEGRERRVGGRFEFGVGDAGFDVGLAVQDERDAFALQHELDVGECRVAVGDQVRRAPSAGSSGPGCGRSRSRSPTLPGTTPGWPGRSRRQAGLVRASSGGTGSVAGSAVRPSGCSPAPAPALVTLTSKPVPSALLACPPTVARQDRVERQALAAADLEARGHRGARAFSALQGPGDAHRVAAGGVELEVRAGRRSRCSRLSCTGMPLSIVGSASPRGPGSVVIVTAAVSGLTLIRERTFT